MTKAPHNSPSLPPNLTSILRRRLIPNVYDMIILVMIAAFFIIIAQIAQKMTQQLPLEIESPIVLDPWNLFEYGARTTTRMLLAIFASLLFTFIIAPLAAKSRRAERIIIPILDILQSVPVLGFISFTVLFFLNLFPGSQMGAECAAIFAIFSAQVWNMTFSFYQSLRSIPKDLGEVSAHLGLSPWMRFWKLEVPFAAPGLLWNTMMSMSGGWFFLVASEAIIARNTKIILPGIGSWLSQAINQEDIAAVIWAVMAMGLIIILYNQFIFAPIVVIIDKYRFEETEGQDKPKSWVYDLFHRTQYLQFIRIPVGWIKVLSSLLLKAFSKSSAGVNFYQTPFPKRNQRSSAIIDHIWIILTIMGITWALWTVYNFIYTSLDKSILTEALIGCLYTFIRVIITLTLASLVWVPIGVWLGLRPWAAQRSKSISQFLAAFPANIFFPFFVVGIVTYNLNPTIWLSPLMIIGAQWYIFFNVIAGASTFPNDLKEVSALFHVGTWNWWRKVILPGILPFYITGMLTAWGAAWNTSIVAEYVSWGPTKLEATGIGSFIAKASEENDFQRIVLGLALLSFIVIIVNRFVWGRLYSAIAPLKNMEDK